jgi:ABC-type antimicrobial peptide transport system permease subunit
VPEILKPDVPDSAAVLVFVHSECRYCTESMGFYRRLATVQAERGTFQIIFVSIQPEDVIYGYLQDHGLVAATIAAPRTVWAPPTLVLVRAKGSSAGLQAALHAIAVGQFGPGAARASALRDESRRLTAHHRSRALLMSALALFAVAVTAFGLYGSVMNMIDRRTREFAIRMVLGADWRRLAYDVMLAVTLVMATGVICGLSAGVALGKWASSLLFDVRAADAGALASVVLLLSVVAAIATIQGIRRLLCLELVTSMKRE